MQFLQMLATFNSVDEGKKNLKEAVQIRDKMGGALYFNVLNADVCEIANKVKKLGGDRKELAEIIGPENFK